MTGITASLRDHPRAWSWLLTAGGVYGMLGFSGDVPVFWERLLISVVAAAGVVLLAHAVIALPHRMADEIERWFRRKTPWGELASIAALVVVLIAAFGGLGARWSRQLSGWLDPFRPESDWLEIVWTLGFAAGVTIPFFVGLALLITAAGILTRRLDHPYVEAWKRNAEEEADAWARQRRGYARFGLEESSVSGTVAPPDRTAPS